MTFAATAMLPDWRDPLINQAVTLLNNNNDWIVQATAYTMIYIYPLFMPRLSHP